MTTESLKYLAGLFAAAGLQYQFCEWQGELKDPYFVGEYNETETLTRAENGRQDATFLLTGYASSWAALEQARKSLCNKLDISTILPNGNGIAVCYSNALPVPTGNPKLKRIQINLNIIEWMVN